jgi:hypothetical protein
METQTTGKLLMFRKQDNELLQEQDYKLIAGNRSWYVSEEGKFINRPDVKAKCEFNLTPRGYSGVRIQIDTPQKNISYEITGSNNNKYTYFFREEDNIQSGEVNLEENLFDGPNPMFDYFNAVMMLGLVDGESIVKKVHAINWSTGDLIPCEYTFSRNGNVIDIKKPDFLGNAKITLSDKDSGLLEYESPEEVYKFSN